MPPTLTNWAGNIAFAPAALHAPRSLDELQTIVRRAGKVKAMGTRHSFNDLADCAGDAISLEHFQNVIAIDTGTPNPTVTVEAGITYGQLCRHLHARGHALHNLASLPHISVGGACATATHGSGVRNPNLAANVVAMKIVTAEGEVVELSRQRDGEQFNGAVVHLGALGIVVNLTLRIEPAFAVAQEVYQRLPLAAVVNDFDAIMSCAYSVSLFTDWRSDRINQVWVKRRIDHPASPRPDLSALGATLASRNLHPIAELPAENCTEQIGIPGPSHERLPHFRMEFTPSAGEELQSEYFVPRADAADALRAIDALRDRIAPTLQISEIRTIARDELWMSPSYQRDSAAIHFTWKKDWPAVRTLLPLIEQQLAPFNARPHWAKLFSLAPARLTALYPKLPAFRELLRVHDPHGKSRNAFLERHNLA